MPIDPDRLSFVHAVRVIKRRLPQSILLFSLIVPIPDGWFDCPKTGSDYTQYPPWKKAKKDAKYLICKRFPLAHGLSQRPGIDVFKLSANRDTTRDP